MSRLASSEGSQRICTDCA
ncbi:hypothetical protein BST30_25845 [Mycobacterium mantenii]|uniref:Uncharacterized protein n=1 Tax=Mycobacterium mantenii TaxID=560555 RepID=A0A1X0FA45_MYCNT|nr:hypothetical protein [Mycobacterium mantenii]ORA98398.1 hypothetical protein BST30_25845 [Mycobacterium mantenii]